MRTDENGQPCPATLGEYRDLCAAIGGEDCPAVQLLDEHISRQGRDAEAIQPDSQMRALLMPLLVSADKIRQEPRAMSRRAAGIVAAVAVLAALILFSRGLDIIRGIPNLEGRQHEAPPGPD